jgi:hypothetical protein
MLYFEDSVPLGNISNVILSVNAHYQMLILFSRCNKREIAITFSAQNKVL